MREGGHPDFRVAIIGGGASGVALAGLLAEIAVPFQIDIFDQGEAILRKLLATGNGRCNFTNRDISPDHYTGEETAALEPSLTAFGFEEARAFFKRLGLPSRVLDSGMTYPATMKADSVVRTLQAWIDHGGVQVHLEKEVVAVRKEGRAYRLSDRRGGDWGPYHVVVLASGGAYGIGKKEWSCGYSLVRDLGHRLTAIHPGICGLVVSERDFCKHASGDKLEADLYLEGEGRPKKRSGDLLFTDYGISGMGVFRLSNDLLGRVRSGREARLYCDLLPHISKEAGERDLTRLYEQRKGWKASEALAGYLPHRLLEASLMEAGIHPFAELSTIPLAQVLGWFQLLKKVSFQVLGARKKDHGQITCGGIAMEDVNPRTLESRLSPGLYFLGEVLNVQGECGGYNLHWAWASAHTAARAIQKAYEKGHDGQPLD